MPSRARAHDAQGARVIVASEHVVIDEPEAFRAKTIEPGLNIAPSSSGRLVMARSQAAAAWALRGADEVVLFTDLPNPVSNVIYQHIGFRPVSDSARINFSVPR
jgi:hypothetical protein